MHRDLLISNAEELLRFYCYLCNLYREECIKSSGSLLCIEEIFKLEYKEQAVFKL